MAANPLVSVAATDGAGTETVDGTDFTFTFSRTGSTAAALTVNYTIQPAPVDGATPGADFPAQTGTITFAAGSATAVLSFDATHDAVVENTEFFSVVVGAGAGYDVDTPNATANASIADGTIIGTNAAETLTGTNDPDAILGLGGDDGLIGGLGADYLDGGAGFDRTIYTNAGAAVNIQLAAGTATIGAVVDTLRSIEFARGTAFDDVYNATGFGPASTPNASSEGNNLNGFEGLGGNDQITGNGNTRAEYTSATAGVTVTFTDRKQRQRGGRHLGRHRHAEQHLLGARQPVRRPVHQFRDDEQHLRRPGRLRHRQLCERRSGGPREPADRQGVRRRRQRRAARQHRQRDDRERDRHRLQRHLRRQRHQPVRRRVRQRYA